MQRSVFVLGVLHDFHQRLEGYTYWHLLRLLDAYGPDLITIEVGPKRYEAGDFRCDSPEKWGIVLPWAIEHGVPVVPTDGGGESAADHHAEYEQAMSELLARPGASDAIAAMEREFKTRFGSDPLKTYLGLTGTYEKANGHEAQELFRWTHDLNAQVHGEGILTDFWQQRNENMARRTVEAMEKCSAHRAIVTVGCEHKYAVDDIFSQRYGMRVLQLADFLDAPIALTASERAAFQSGRVPINYPSDLMFVHRKLHGGEPNAYNQELPSHPDALDLDGVAERIDKALATDGADADMIYYHGLLNYVKREYHRAAADFDLAAADRSRLVAFTWPLWQLATLRAGQMIDLLGDRQTACERYRTVALQGKQWLRSQAERFLEQPFARPA